MPGTKPKKPAKPLSTGLSYYKGRPLLVIENGPFRPFKMSVGKVKALLQLRDKMEQFVKEYDRPVNPEPVGARPVEQAESDTTSQELQNIS